MKLTVKAETARKNIKKYLLNTVGISLISKHIDLNKMTNYCVETFGDYLYTYNADNSYYYNKDGVFGYWWHRTKIVFYFKNKEDVLRFKIRWV